MYLATDIEAGALSVPVGTTREGSKVSGVTLLLESPNRNQLFPAVTLIEVKPLLEKAPDDPRPIKPPASILRILSL